MPAEKFFDTIRDGVWHNLSELSAQVGVPLDRLVEYARFLSKKGLAEYDEKAQRIKIEPELIAIIPDEAATEENKAQN